jgi:hypothetical protein
MIQRAHIAPSLIAIMEKDPLEEKRAIAQAKKEEEERIAAQEKIYQVEIILYNNYIGY